MMQGKKICLYGLFDKLPVYKVIKTRQQLGSDYDKFTSIYYELFLPTSKDFKNPILWCRCYTDYYSLQYGEYVCGDILRIPKHMLRKKQANKICDCLYLTIEHRKTSWSCERPTTYETIYLQPTKNQIDDLASILMDLTPLILEICLGIFQYVIGSLHAPLMIRD